VVSLSVLKTVLLLLFRIGRRVTLKGLSQITLLFKSGILSFAMLTLIVVLGNMEALQQSIQLRTPVPLIKNIGISLGESLTTILSELQSVPDGLKPKLESLWNIALAASHIGWYYKGFVILSESSAGEDVPRDYLVSVWLIIFVLLVYSATNGFPKPAEFEVVKNLPEFFQVSPEFPDFVPDEVADVVAENLNGLTDSSRNMNRTG